MNRRNVLPVGVAAAVVASAGIALLTASPAAAATCNAPAGSYCVAVEYRTSTVKSIRVNGRCLIGPSNTHSTVHIGQHDAVRIQTYGGTKCEGGTQTVANTAVHTRDDSRWRLIRVYQA
ncbi:hypothetical protein OG205_16730 [Lentzea sp. NBC_00516]|uniref:hypothetical protein n=1 Tax=Lentzea sp. NBC_00516 TaxID=2903582 RepID=UPI002E808815|nr:hypothetical protein [Lentzea sp. NBC_00516]WUD28581.1 hypothetical protein OG205_16730 [Lentzea sp. NBC_00516]